MSKPMELPAEGEVVLGFWGDDDCMVTWLDGGKWMIQGYKRPAPTPPDRWVPLPLARKAREMEAARLAIMARCREASAALPSGDVLDMEGGSITIPVELLVALRDAGMGGGE